MFVAICCVETRCYKHVRHSLRPAYAKARCHGQAKQNVMKQALHNNIHIRVGIQGERKQQHEEIHAQNVD